MKTTIGIDEVTLRTAPPDVPMHSPYGYIITPSGVTFALMKQWTHGLILALLYPDAANEYNKTAELPFEWPESRDDIDVMAFQRFELTCAKDLHCIRICASRLLSPTSVDLPVGACTPEQIEAMRLALRKGLGMKDADTVSMDHFDTTVKRLFETPHLDAEARLEVNYRARKENRDEW